MLQSVRLLKPVWSATPPPSQQDLRKSQAIVITVTDIGSGICGYLPNSFLSVPKNPLPQHRLNAVFSRRYLSDTFTDGEILLKHHHDKLSTISGLAAFNAGSKMFHFNLLPTPLILFAFLSTLFALIAFILSLLDFSVEVAVMSSISAFATMGYHLTLIVMAYRERQKRRADAIFLTRSAQRRAGPTHRYYTVAGIIWAYLLFAIWIISFGINAQVTSNGMASIKPEDRNNVWNLGIQVAVSCFAGFEALVVGAMAVHNMLARRKMPVLEKAETAVSKFNEKRASEVSTSRRSIASSRFSVDSIAAIPAARTKYGIKPLTLLRGKVARPVFNLSKYRP